MYFSFPQFILTLAYQFQTHENCIGTFCFKYCLYYRVCNTGNILQIWTFLKFKICALLQFQNASAKSASLARNQRLLVKVIKANSLGDKDFGTYLFTIVISWHSSTFGDVTKFSAFLPRERIQWNQKICASIIVIPMIPCNLPVAVSDAGAVWNIHM